MSYGWHATHVIRHAGSVIEVMLVARRWEWISWAYTRAEWDLRQPAIYSKQANGTWLFLGRSFPHEVEEIHETAHRA